MKNTLFAAALVAMFITASAFAEDHKPVSIGPYISVPAQRGTEPVMTKDWHPTSVPHGFPFSKGTDFACTTQETSTPAIPTRTAPAPLATELTIARYMKR